MTVCDNVSLKPYNTFGIDVRARRMVVIEPDDDLSALELEEPFLFLGGGSNMVFTKDYDGTVVRVESGEWRAEMADAHNNSALIRVWAGMVMDDLVQWSLDNGLYGLENLSAIPGTVGASAVQNVGAYGAEAKDFIECVEAYDLQEHRLCTLGNADCHFAYRHSLFKEQPGRYLILWVTYRLNPTFVPNLSYKALEGVPHTTAMELREAIIDIRWSKLPRPEEHGSAGSFFKNPVVTAEVYERLRAEYPDMPEAHLSPFTFHLSPCYKLSAGWLIDRAGWKGRTMGRAGVWPKNALVLYNTGGCTGSEVVALADAIVADIRSKFGITLTPEAIMI